MAEAVVSIVAGRLTDLLTEEPQLYEVKDEIKQLVSVLRELMRYLRDADSRISEYRIRNLLADVQELAYDAEHLVKSFILKTSSSPGKAMQWLNRKTFLRNLKDIQRKMSLLFNRFHDNNIEAILELPESPNTLHEIPQEKLRRFHSYAVVEPHIFVGSREDVDRLVGHLVDESDDCYPLISICGMGGLGKTTLAQKIYNHSTVKNYFAGFAWVSISQKWQKTHVLQRILICLIHEKKKEILKMDDDSLIHNLLEIQKKKKCLIVLDDICSTDAWDSLKPAFITVNSVSKLMLTTRKFKVAEYVNPEGFIHQPEFLDAEESWELLKLGALPSGRDYLDTRDLKRMEELGRKLVGNCAGLPLAIVILGGILVTKPSLIEWQKVYDDFPYDNSPWSSKGIGLGGTFYYHRELSLILSSSYNDLPLQLKPYFLNLG